jgi:hypothetical protein
MALLSLEFSVITKLQWCFSSLELYILQTQEFLMQSLSSLPKNPFSNAMQTFLSRIFLLGAVRKPHGPNSISLPLLYILLATFQFMVPLSSVFISLISFVCAFIGNEALGGER